VLVTEPPRVRGLVGWSVRNAGARISMVAGIINRRARGLGKALP
jgi:hypothetical protein